MKKLRTLAFPTATDGSVGVEYALIASVISILIATAATEIGQEIVGFFDAVVKGFPVV